MRVVSDHAHAGRVFDCVVPPDSPVPSGPHVALNAAGSDRPTRNKGGPCSSAGGNTPPRAAASVTSANTSRSWVDFVTPIAVERVRLASATGWPWPTPSIHAPDRSATRSPPRRTRPHPDTAPSTASPTTQPAEQSPAAVAGGCKEGGCRSEGKGAVVIGDGLAVDLTALRVYRIYPPEVAAVNWLRAAVTARVGNHTRGLRKGAS